MRANSKTEQVGVWVSALTLLLLLHSAQPRTLHEIIDHLTAKLLDEQITKNTTWNPIHQKFIGLWPSYIHINFVGDPLRTFMRNDVTMYDNNMFVTAWITELLLEANQMKFTSFPEENLNRAINSLLAFRDKNYPSPSPVYSFWPQVLKNGTYVADPVNLFNFFDIIHINSTNNTSQAHAFYIPADFDDSMVSLAISCSLWEQRDEYAGAYHNWSTANFGSSPSSSFSFLSSALKACAYKPFSNDSNVNIIDPRTYFWLVDFLTHTFNQSKVEGSEGNVTLITTWALDQSLNRHSYYQLYSMPFNVNNVDGSVMANTIYGLTRALLTHNNLSSDWFDPELQQLYFHSSSLLTWIIEKEMLNWRPDLILLYYMGNYNFYWFVSRTLYLLNSAPSLPFPVMEQTRSMFQSSLRSNATSILLSSSQWDGKYAFWDNFIGVNDTTRDGTPINHADDRLCTTAVAIDTLIFIWTKNTTKCKFEYVEDTPEEVKSIISAAVQWLNDHVIDHIILGSKPHYRRENAFFSGSVKAKDLPFYFPINFAQYLNGTNLPGYHSLRDFKYISDDLIVGIEGFIPSSQYQSMVNNEKWFGMQTPVDWEGYNTSSNGSLIYWSAPSLTYATSINALGKYLNTC